MLKTSRRTLHRSAVACLLALGLTACGSSDTSDKNVSGSDIQAALEKGGSLTVWAWEPTLKQVAKDFEAEHPKVDVELVNAGTGDDQYTALQNAIKAGSGVPDVAQLEYYALGQFSVAGSVTDLADFGAGELANDYTPGTWNSVSFSGGIHALPMDSGPMALFYNKDVFDKHGVEVPKTWDEYVEAARKLHQADPDLYITNDTGEAGFATSLIWQAGGRPYSADGTKVSVDFTDEGTTTYAETWQKLIDEDLLAPTSSWSDAWYKGLSNGAIATLPLGAWMPANLESGVPEGSGSWRVAPLPQWEPGAAASAENGGSSLAIPEASGNKELAYAFIEYANAGPGVQTRIDNGAFPATTADLKSHEFLNEEFEYFGGQKANKIFAESAGNVEKDWTYLPFQVYANSVFNNTVGKAYVSDMPLMQGLEKWGATSREYGTQQGFTVGK